MRTNRSKAAQLQVRPNCWNQQPMLPLMATNRSMAWTILRPSNCCWDPETADLASDWRVAATDLPLKHQAMQLLYWPQVQLSELALEAQWQTPVLEWLCHRLQWLHLQRLSLTWSPVLHLTDAVSLGSQESSARAALCWRSSMSRLHSWEFRCIVLLSFGLVWSIQWFLCAFACCPPWSQTVQVLVSTSGSFCSHLWRTTSLFWDWQQSCSISSLISLFVMRA